MSPRSASRTVDGIQAHVPMALFAESPPDAGTAIGLTIVVVKLANRGKQVSIGHCPGSSGRARQAKYPVGEAASARHIRRIG